VFSLLYVAPHPVLGFLTGPCPVGFAGRNHYRVVRDGQGPVFTFGTTRNMMHKSLENWENQVVEEALRRDAALREQRRELDNDGGACDL